MHLSSPRSQQNATSVLKNSVCMSCFPPTTIGASWSYCLDRTSSRPFTNTPSELLEFSEDWLCRRFCTSRVGQLSRDNTPRRCWRAHVLFSGVSWDSCAHDARAEVKRWIILPSPLGFYCCQRNHFKTVNLNF